MLQYDPPIKQLQPPNRAFDRFISRLASLIKEDPTPIRTDVPPFYADAGEMKFVVDRDLRLDAPGYPEQTGTIPVPAVSVGDLNWLQLYAVDSGKDVK